MLTLRIQHDWRVNRKAVLCSENACDNRALVFGGQVSSIFAKELDFHLSADKGRRAGRGDIAAKQGYKVPKSSISLGKHTKLVSVV